MMPSRPSVLGLILVSVFTFAACNPVARAARPAAFEVPRLWEYSAPLIAPEVREAHPSRAQKDPSVVFHDGRWHVFMTVKLPGKSAIEYCSFAQWEEADAAPRALLAVSDSDYYCAPQVFYFRPHRKWYLIYQMGVPGADKMWVAYSTTTNIADPGSWTTARPILDGGPDDPREVGGLDYWIICDEARAYLFFTSLDGRMWRLRTRLEDFPAGFGHCELALRAKVFEASHTYKLKGLDQYLTLIEENGRRFYKAYVADRLDGEWRPVADTAERPFAGWTNIRPAAGVAPWTDNVSHGELIRDGVDETLAVDPNHLRFVFQGMWDKDKSGIGYGQFQWRIGLLTPAAVEPLIRAAGNADDEAERLRRLRELDARSDLEPALRADLAKLLPVVEDWADGKSRLVADTSRAAENGYLCRFITSRVRPVSEGPVFPPELSEGSPLRPIWCLYRGRMLIWRVIQSGPLLRVPESRERYYDEARRLLEEVRAAFPENRIVRMYLGEPIPWPELHPPDPEAPAWANLQREGLEKLSALIHWWINERQIEDGQFGGGWGDDVEMWRWWTPVLIGFDDPVIEAAQERLSSGMFRQPHLRAGFTSRVTDVEHSNEDTTDTILPMMHVRPEDPLWSGRALRLAELMRDRWTGCNDRGLLQFKSIYFSVDKVDDGPDRAFDTVYHPSVIQPALLYWQRTGDPQLGALFGEWLKVWVDAAAGTENGKPGGVLPSAIRWPDGGIAKTDRPWWEPFSPGHNDALYNWPGAARLMTSTLLLAHHMTAQEDYLQPIRSMTALRLEHRGAPDGDPGSAAWCARRISGFLSDTLAKYRFLTGDRQYDPLLRADASGYVRYRLTGEVAALEADLRRNGEAFRSNWEAYTAEMRWTDRVMSFTRNYLRYLPEPAPAAPTPEILYSTVTGDPGNPLVFPLNAVRWRTPARNLAALVVESGRNTFAAELFHFGDEPRDLGAELFLLAPGDYEVTVKVVGADAPPLRRDSLRVEGPRASVSLRLPPRRLCVLQVKPA